jgi:hypothetical protein
VSNSCLEQESSSRSHCVPNHPLLHITFNLNFQSVLHVIYPYALNRLLRNPSDSSVVDDTLQSLIRSESGRVDREKVRKLLDDAALITGYKRRKVLLDIIGTQGGLRLTKNIVQESLSSFWFPGRWNPRRRF